MNTLDVQEGTLRIRDNGVNDGDATSRVNKLMIASGAVFDLRDNDLVIDYDGASPIGTPAYNDPDTVAKYIKDGFGGGTWNGTTGLKTSVAASPFSALGFAEAGSLSISTWQGVAVDDTTVVIRYTFQGDSNVDGTVDIGDFSILASNFNSPQIWYGGDYNYDGVADIGDFALQAGNFNLTGRRGSGPDGLADLYIAMLRFPQLYHEARDWTEFWNEYFAIYETMNLGAVPSRPENFRAGAAIPEPAAALAGTLALLLSRRWRT